MLRLRRRFTLLHQPPLPAHPVLRLRRRSTLLLQPPLPALSVLRLPRRFAVRLRMLFASRMQHAAHAIFLASASQEQQKILVTLAQLTTMFEESGVLAHCDKGRASIRLTELDQCHPVTGFLAILLCPACSTQAGNPAA